MYGNSLKLHQEMFKLNIKDEFFTEKVVGHWNKHPWEVVMAPSLLVFEKHFDNALSNMV